MTRWEVLEEQTALLLETVSALSADDLAGASALPGWSRGHVLGHLAGNAEGLGRRARFVADGVPRSMYESLESRDADIERRAGRTREEHLQALAATHVDLMRDFANMPEDRLADEIELRMGTMLRADQLPLMRLQEVCIHHADLAVDAYAWRDWPDSFVDVVFPRVVRSFTGRDDVPVEWIEADGERATLSSASGPGLVGSRLELLAWFTGRSPGTGLDPVGLDEVPTAPRWL